MWMSLWVIALLFIWFQIVDYSDPESVKVGYVFTGVILFIELIIWTVTHRSSKKTQQLNKVYQDNIKSWKDIEHINLLPNFHKNVVCYKYWKEL